MIGDNIEADILGALNFGMKALHCNFEEEVIEIQSFDSIEKLSDIKQYL